MDGGSLQARVSLLVANALYHSNHMYTTQIGLPGTTAALSRQTVQMPASSCHDKDTDTTLTDSQYFVAVTCELSSCNNE